jgi:MFS family permease
LTSFLVVYLTQAIGLDLVTAGFLLSASQVAGVVGRLAWGHAADRVGRPRRLLLAIGLLMAAATALASLFSLNWPLPLIGATIILLGATASGWNGVFLAEVMRAVDPARAGLATSGSLTFTFLGVVLGPPLFGIAAASLGYAVAFAIMAGVVLLGGLVLSGALAPARAR